MLRVVTDEISEDGTRRRTCGVPNGGPRHGWEGYRHILCRGRPVFRSRYALDLALILDLDPEVESWECLPTPIEILDEHGDVESRVVDFRVHRIDGSAYHIDADGVWGQRSVDRSVEYLIASHADLLNDLVVRNARGVMSYSGMDVPLADQVRLLKLVGDAGSVTLSEAAGAMRATCEPVGAVMALAARRVVQLDWTSSVVGPRTAVGLFRLARPIFPCRIAASNHRHHR